MHTTTKMASLTGGGRDVMIGGDDLGNPLKISPWLSCVVFVYLPVVVILSLVLNSLAMDILKSKYLKDLISRPFLKSLLHCHLLLPIIGPAYVWLVQGANVFITTHQVYPCFLLLSIHNALMLISAWIPVLWIMERAITLNKANSLWPMWQTACGRVVALTVAVAVLVSLGPLVVMKGPVPPGVALPAHPVCLPWWGQDAKNGWFFYIIMLSTMAPTLAALVAILVLAVCMTRFYRAIQFGSRGLDHYQAATIGLKSVMRVKFAVTVVWIAVLMLATSGPLGLFKLLAMDAPSWCSHSLETRRPASGNSSIPDVAVVNMTSHPATVLVDGADEARAMQFLLCIKYADRECIAWILYYSLSWLLFPVLVASEVLFRREWKGEILAIASRLLCFLGKGQTIHSMTVRIHTTTLSNSDISTFRGEDILSKLHPPSGRQLPSFINRSVNPKRIKIQRVASDGHDPKGTSPDDVKPTNTDYFGDVKPKDITCA